MQKRHSKQVTVLVIITFINHRLLMSYDNVKIMIYKIPFNVFKRKTDRQLSSPLLGDSKLQVIIIPLMKSKQPTKDGR